MTISKEDLQGISIEELRSLGLDSLSLRAKTKAYFAGTQAIRDFAYQVMLPLLKGQLNLRPIEKALYGTYLRMYAWIDSVIRLNKIADLQAVGSAARALFEQLVDIELLVANIPNDAVTKFFEFTKVARFHYAQKYHDYESKKVVTPPTHTLSNLRKLVNDPQEKAKIEQLVITHWGKTKSGKPNFPDHWSNMPLNERASKIDAHGSAAPNKKSIKYEGHYREYYPFFSWQVHPGLVGFGGLDVSDLEVFFVRAHSEISALFTIATLIVADQLKLTPAINAHARANLPSLIEEIRLVPGEEIVKEQVKTLKKLKKTSLEDDKKEIS
ncbi:MAG: DUF5677 domain-containing protein [Candidatus Omnitrophota bacterium]